MVTARAWQLKISNAAKGTRNPKHIYMYTCTVENLKRGQGYTKSKTLAEKKAWELVKDTKLALAVVNPAVIVGPLLSDTGGEASQMLVSLLCVLTF